MHRKLAALVGAGALAVVAAGTGPAFADPEGLSLKPRAARFVGAEFKSVGGGKDAKASWTTTEARTGNHSVYLAKNVPTSDPAAAVIDVQGIAGTPFADLETLSMSVNGYCSGGAPRFNVYWDNDGDGSIDGYGFYGCANHVSGQDGVWTLVSADSQAPDSVVEQPPAPGATVLHVQIVMDEQGSTYVDDVGLAGEEIGEPGR
jgi:hypothetical protein